MGVHGDVGEAPREVGGGGLHADGVRARLLALGARAPLPGGPPAHAPPHLENNRDPWPPLGSEYRRACTEARGGIGFRHILSPH